MKKISKVIFVFLLSVALLCTLSNVKAATTNELISYASKTFTVAGESVKLPDSYLVKVKRYLSEYPVSSGNADKIIAKIDEGIALMNAAGVSDPSKLSKEKKDELLQIAQDAATLAGASISYDSTNKVVTIYKDGVIWDTIDLSNSFKQTGNNSNVYIAVAGVVIIAIAALIGYRRVKVNA